MLRRTALAGLLLCAGAIAQTVPRPTTVPAPPPVTPPSQPADPEMEQEADTPAVPLPDAVPAPAQPAAQPTAQPATPPAPGAQPPVPAAQVPVPGPGTAPTTQPPTFTTPRSQPAQLSSDGTVQMRFTPSSDVKEVLDLYARLTGARLIYDNTVTGPVPINISDRVPKEEAIRIMEIALLMNGFSLVPVDGTNLVKVAGIGRNPATLGVPIISHESQLPDNEQVVTYLYKLEYADPMELSQTLSQVVVPSQQGYTKVVPLPKAQALLITENVPIIRGLIQIIDEVDVPPAEVVSEFITLQRADAKEVLDKLTTMFERRDQPQQTTGAPAAAPRPGTQPTVRTLPDGLPAPPNVEAQATSPTSVELTSSSLSEDTIIVGKIKLTADERTNRIHVITRPINLRFIRTLLQEFDADVPFGNPAVRPLRYVEASKILDSIVQAVQDPGAQNNANTQAGGALGQQRPGTQQGTAAQGRNLFSNNQTGVGGGGGIGGGTGGFSETVFTSQRIDEPQAVVVGNTRIIADNRNNSIIVIGTQDVTAKIFRLIDELDVRAPQVMIHTVIGELSLADGTEWGINYILRNGGNLSVLGAVPPTTGTDGTDGGTDGGGATDGTSSAGAITVDGSGVPILNFNTLMRQNDITRVLGAGSGGLTGFVAAGNAFDAIINSLSTSNRFKIISRPSIFTSNNKKAVISSGEEIAVPTTIQSGFTGGTINNGSNLVTNSSIQFKTVALQLEVLPLINDRGEVALEIVQKIDDQNGTTRIDGNDIPRIATRVLQTYVTVPNGGTLILGGLIKARSDKTKNGIPILKDIPVIGGLFGGGSKTKTRQELIIMLRPVVTANTDEDSALRERSLEYFTTEPDLESTLIPPNVRQRVPPEEPLLRHKRQPKLREHVESFKSSKK